MVSLRNLLGSFLLLSVFIALSEGVVPRPRIPQLFHNRFHHHAVDDSSSIPPFETSWFQQQVDHFNLEDTRTWSQRYLTTSLYLNQSVVNPVIIFYTGNEGAINLFWNNTGFAFDLASSFNAYVVFAEHRYYGESLPFGDSSFDLDKVGYLTVEQALADYANLIYNIKSQNPNLADSPVVSLGGSYGGMLTAWFRMKYPNVVTAALAGSAPIMQFEGSNTDPEAFNYIITQDFEQASSNSSNRVREAFNLINELGQTQEGLLELQTKFRVCGALTNSADLVNWIESGFSYEAMGDYPYPANFLTPMPGYPINVSAPLINEGSDVLVALANGLNVYYNYTGEAGSCFNLSVVVTDSLGLQAWDYQACTELVLVVTSDFVNDFFPPSPWNYTALAEYCQYYWNVTPDATWASTYGYNNLAGASNIIFSNGILDPWRGGGVQESVSSSLPAIVIEGGAHHLDLRSPNPLDPEAVVAAREKEFEFLQSWVEEAYLLLKQKKN